MTLYSVNAVLEIHYTDNRQVEVLIDGNLNITAEDGNVVDSEIMQGYVEKMSEVAQQHAQGRPHTWILLMAYEGRCWFMEPVEEGTGIGYYDVDTVKGWLTLNEQD